MTKTLLVLGFTLVGISSANAQTWNLTNDFALFPNQANPNPDSYGNSSVWYYMDGSTANNPATYSLIPTFYVNAFGDPGVEAWAINDSIPEVGYYPVALPGVVDFAGINLHPGSSGPTIIGWRSPISGEVTAAGFFTEANPAQAAGVGCNESLSDRV